MQTDEKSKKRPVIGVLLFILAFLIGAIPRADYDVWRQLTRFDIYMIDAVRVIMVILGLAQIGSFKSKKQMYITILICVVALVIGGTYILLR